MFSSTVYTHLYLSEDRKYIQMKFIKKQPFQTILEKERMSSSLASVQQTQGQTHYTNGISNNCEAK